MRTAVVGEVAALGVEPTTPAATSQLAAAGLRVWVRTRTARGLLAALVLAAYGVHVAFPTPRTCCEGRTLPAARETAPVVALGLPERASNAPGGGAVVVATSLVPPAT